METNIWKGWETQFSPIETYKVFITSVLLHGMSFGSPHDALIHFILSSETRDIFNSDFSRHIKNIYVR